MIEIRKNAHDNEMIELVTDKPKVLWGVLHVDAIDLMAQDNMAALQLLDDGEPLYLALVDENGYRV